MFRRFKEDEYSFSRLAYIIEAALEYFVAIMVSGAFLARITDYLGFSDSLTGVLSSFVSLGCIFQMGAVALARRGGTVKRMSILYQLFSEVLMVLVYLSPVAPMSQTVKIGIFLFCFCAGTVLLNLTKPLKVNWLMSLVDDRSRGIFTARKEMFSLLGGMIFTYAMGWMIDLYELRGEKEQAFIVGAIALFAVSAFHIAMMILIKEKPSEQETSSSGLLSGISVLFKDKMFRRIVLVCVLWNVASYCAVPYYAPYQIKELGFSMTFVSVLSIVQSVVRIAFSPTMGHYADKHSFSKMVYLCFFMATIGFLVICFAVPENGKVMFIIYNVVHAIAMAGINSAVTNLIFDYISGSNRRDALALNASISGVMGFVATCLASPVVALIQKNGNKLFGIGMYPAQFFSAVAVVIMLFLLVYTRFALVSHDRRKDQ